MNGSIVKRGSGYAVVIELPRDPVTGRRRQKWHSGYRTKREAERSRVELLNTVNNGTYIEPSKQAIAEYLSEWFDTIAPTVRPSTLDSYRRKMRLHVTPHIGTVPLQQIDGVTLNGLYAKLLSEGSQRRGKDDSPVGLSNSTVRSVHTVLGRAFKDAVRSGRLLKNPADAATPPRASAETNHRMKTWSAHEVRAFLDASDSAGDRYRAAWFLLATTGMRRGECLGLRWADVDLSAGTASIRQTVVMSGRQVLFSTPKTAKGRRQIALDAATVAVLREHRSRQLEERLMLGAGWRDNDLVFTKVDGSPVHPERFSRTFDRRVVRYGMPKIRLHDLRHGWATLALAAGVHPKVVSERLGHATVSITLDIYSHATPAMQASAAEVVAATLFGSAS